jgi:hypothetical protein
MEIQTTENCFRCGTIGSTSTRRLSQNTYIPSYKLRADLLGAVNILIAADSPYRKAITFTEDVGTTFGGGTVAAEDVGLVRIYESVCNDLNEEFQKAAALNITFHTAMIKPYTESTNPNQNTLPCAIQTMEDTTNFLKVDAQGNTGDKGLYAARTAYAKYGGPPWREAPAPPSATVPNQEPTPLAASLSAAVPYGTDPSLPATPADVTIVMAEVDPNGIMADTVCDDETNENVSEIENCPPPSEYLYSLPEDIEAQEAGAAGDVATGGACHIYSYLSALALLPAAYFF